MDDFDFNAWAANTVITLTNIPLRPDYMFVASPARVAKINELIDEQPDNYTYTNSKYAPIDRPIMLDKTYNELARFNYVRVYNPAQPGKSPDRANYFYYFIQDVVYHARDTTQLIVQLDAWTTCINRVRIGRGFLETGHLGIANEAQMSNNGRDYLTVPEGIDVGVDHVVAHAGGDFPIMRYGDQGVLVTSTLDLELNAGSTRNPVINVAKAQISAGMISGTSQYLFPSASNFLAFMVTRRDQAHLIAGITSVIYIPNPSRYWSSGELGALLSIGAYRMPTGMAPRKRKVSLANWRKDAKILKRIPRRFRHLSKMLTYPYTYVFLSNKQGQSVVLRPELIAGDDLVYYEEAAFSEGGQRIQWFVDGYNADAPSVIDGAIQGLGVDYSVFINNFPQTSVTVDGGLLAMARSSQSIAFASTQANWNQRKGLAANQLGFDQANTGINLSTDLMNSEIKTQQRALGIDQSLQSKTNLTNIGNNVVAGAGIGVLAGAPGIAVGAAAGLAGAAAGSLNLLASQRAGRDQLRNSMTGAMRNNALGGAAAGSIRDTNKTYQDFATRGDYESEIAGLKAATADIMASPPSAVGQSGGEATNFLRWRTGFDLHVRMMDNNHMTVVGEYWLRYGYAVQRYIQVPNELQVMTHFTYWKMKDLSIQGNIPDRFIATLRGIIEKGVTVVEDPFEIGVIDPSINKPLPGYVIGGIVELPEIPDPPVIPPITTRRKRKNMLVYSTVSTNPSAPGNTWALAGSAPGTDANFQVTTDAARADMYLDATGQERPVGVTETEFLLLANQYRSPVSIIATEGDAA